MWIYSTAHTDPGMLAEKRLTPLCCWPQSAHLASSPGVLLLPHPRPYGPPGAPASSHKVPGLCASGINQIHGTRAMGYWRSGGLHHGDSMRSVACVVFFPPGGLGVALCGHLTHSRKAVYPHLIRSMQLGGSVLHRRQWARVTCQRKMPSCFRLALRMDRFPTMHQCKRHAESAEKIKSGGKSCACHAPALALSRMRLQVPPGWSLKSLSRGSCLGLPTWGFIWVSHGGQLGWAPPLASPLYQGQPRVTVTRNAPCQALHTQEDAHVHFPGMLGSANSSSPCAKLLTCSTAGWLMEKGNSSIVHHSKDRRRMERNPAQTAGWGERDATGMLAVSQPQC